MAKTLQEQFLGSRLTNVVRNTIQLVFKLVEDSIGAEQSLVVKDVFAKELQVYSNQLDLELR